jgi:hypothetical protein
MNENSNRIAAVGAQGYGKDVGLSASQFGLVGGAAVGDCCARQSAKSVIRDRVRQLRGQADELEALARALPEELPPQADAVLWRLVIDARR